MPMWVSISRCAEYFIVSLILSLLFLFILRFLFYGISRGFCLYSSNCYFLVCGICVVECGCGVAFKRLLRWPCVPTALWLCQNFCVRIGIFFIYIHMFL